MRQCLCKLCEGAAKVELVFFEASLVNFEFLEEVRLLSGSGGVLVVWVALLPVVAPEF